MGPQSPVFAVAGLHCADHELGDKCRYQVAWVINPHMTVGAVDFERASAEYAAFTADLRDSGARLELLPFVHGAHGSVFLKDPALLWRAAAAAVRCWRGFTMPSAGRNAAHVRGRMRKRATTSSAMIKDRTGKAAMS